LARRTSITLEDRQRGLGIVDEVATLMAKEQDWSTEQQQSMVDAYRSVIEGQIAAENAPVAMLMQPPSSL
jgi:glycerol-3-phosphate dehydrogenase